MRHILLTGLPGVGKTTLIRKIAERLALYRPAGFYTEEIRVHDIRQGFRLVALNNRELILSHVDHRGPYRVGRYGVDVAGLDRLLAELDLGHSSSRLIIVDEIGKMECLSARFVEDMGALFDSPKLVLATAALKGEGLIRQVKHRPDCQAITVTVENRERLADDLVTEVVRQLGAPAGSGTGEG